MTSKRKKLDKPRVEITVAPLADRGLKGAYDSILKTMAGVQELAIAQSKPLADILGQQGWIIDSSIKQMAVEYADIIGGAKGWADGIASIPWTQGDSITFLPESAYRVGEAIDILAPALRTEGVFYAPKPEREELAESMEAMKGEIESLKAQVRLLQEKHARPSETHPLVRGPNLDTVAKLEALSLFRQDDIEHHRRIRGWIVACQQAGIDPKTARRYASDLRAHWEDPSFRRRSDS